MINELSCLSSCKSESHSENNIIKSGFEANDKVITCLAFHLRSDFIVVIELLLKNTIDELELLLLFELESVFRNLSSAISIRIHLGFLIDADNGWADAQISASL